MAPIRIGILGAAKIAPGALIEPAKGRQDIHIVAVAARDPARAQAFADQHGIPIAVAGYEWLIERDDIDAIYNALPPSRHADLTIAALQSGKHVLCEKPFALNAAEAQAMVLAASSADRVLMEAFHYRYHPLFDDLLKTVRGGQLGTLHEIIATFVVKVPERDGELRFDPRLGGGGLMDMGTYCVHWCRSIAGREPVVRAAQMQMGHTGVDLHTRAELDFGAGLTARIDCGMDLPFSARIEVKGSAGRLVAENPLVPQFGHRLTLELNGHEAEHRTFDRVSTYACQLQVFVDAVSRDVVPVTSGADSIAQMKVIDAIRGLA